jgi:hypothetical protein
MRLELPQLNTKVDVFVGPNPDADPPFYYWNFTVDPLAQFLQVVVIGAGGGGGSGRQGATGTIRGGGQGGAGGAYNTGFYPAYMLDPTANFNVLAGAGGAGGAPQTNPDTSGIGGTDGGNSMFHNFVRAEGGIRGQGGFNVTSPNAYRIGTYNTPWPGGGTAAATLGGHSFDMSPGALYEDPDGYTGAVSAVWATATGGLNVTELT